MQKYYLDILTSVLQGKHTASNKNDKILLIDGMNMFIRTFSASPLTNNNGEHVGGYIGFLLSLSNVIKLFNPTRCIIVFDGKGGSAARRKLYPEYKQGRKMNIHINRSEYLKDDDITIEHLVALKKIQLSKLLDYLDCLPITTIVIDNIEADDVISHISNKIYNNSNIIISSDDKDFLQLINNNISVYRPTSKKLIDVNNILELFGNIPSHNFIIYKIFIGDTSDNINGIKGIGEKTLIKYIPIILNKEKIIQLTDIIEYCKDIIFKIENDINIKESKKKSQKRIYDLILNNIDILNRNYQLMSLSDININASITSKINHICENNINKLNKFKFMQLYIRDSITMQNLETWILNFMHLNSYN